MDDLLLIESLSRSFGGLQAVKNLSMEIRSGEIFGLIGPNGAGKSTTLNMIDGSLAVSGGQIIFKKQVITHIPPHSRAKRGIARVFQRDVLFHSLTVIGNVILSLHLHSNLGIKEVLFPWSSGTKRKEDRLQEKAMALLRFVGLDDQAQRPSATLPHGSKRVLGLAIAMATGADLFLLDEPLTGMNAEETDFMVGCIRKLRDAMTATIAIVEHNMRAVMDLCDRVIVLDYGEKIAEGLPRQVIQEQRVIEAYLGMECDAA